MSTLSSPGTTTPPPPYEPTATSRSTPLPSYTSSPVLPPTQPPSPSLFKLLPHTTTTTTTTVAPSISTHIAATLIAIFGPTLVDLAWLSSLNALGLLLTLLQLPLAVALAVQFHCGSPMAQSGEKSRTARVKQGQECWLMLVTQAMWDWHDWLEEAELEGPSRWVRAA